MRFVAVLGFIVLFGLLPSVAQKATPADLKLRAVEASPASMCPLDMHVRQGIGSKMMAVDDHGAQVEMFAARLKLLLKDMRPNQTSQQMVKATVTVHGLNGKDQILPADSRSGRSADVAKTLTVRLATDGEPEVSGDLLLPGFTAALMLDLESVTYDDGTVMKFSGSEACRATPDMLMPVRGS
jgi:hypothetical protein